MSESIGQNFALCKGKTLPADERHNFAVDYRRTLRENLRLLIERRGDTSKSLARRAHYTAGTKKGERVSERTVRYVLDPNPEAPSPSLDALAAIAKAYDLPVWGLLLPDVDPSSPAVVDLDAQIDARAGELLGEALNAQRKLKAQDVPGRSGGRYPFAVGSAIQAAPERAPTGGRKRRTAASRPKATEKG